MWFPDVDIALNMFVQVLWMVLTATVRCDRQDSDIRTSNFRMRIVSRRDHTGRWTIQTHSDRLIGKNRSSEVVIDLEQNITSIAHRESVSLAASVQLDRIADCSDEDNALMHRPYWEQSNTSSMSWWEGKPNSSWWFRPTTPSSWSNATTSFWWERRTTSNSTRNRAVLPRRVPRWRNDDIIAGTTGTRTETINYEKPTTESSRMTTAPPPKDYEEFPGVGYYKATKKVLTWDDARKACKEDGAHLMVIDTDQKKEVFKILYLRQWPKVSSDGTYLVNLVGLYDPGKTGHFVTVLGDPVEKSRWAPGQPDGGDQHCGAARWTGELHDISCSMKSAYICEISL